MLKKRIFLSIFIPSQIKEELVNIKESYKSLPIKWTNNDNLHITLFFIGFLSEEKINILKEEIKRVTLNYNQFFIYLEDISYYPKKREKSEYVWVNIKKTKELIKLNGDIKKILLKNNIKIFEEKEFLPHITLAKINKTKWRNIDLEEIPMIEENINTKFKVDKIEIIESKLNRKESNYVILEKIKLR